MRLKAHEKTADIQRKSLAGYETVEFQLPFCEQSASATSSSMRKARFRNHSSSARMRSCGWRPDVQAKAEGSLFAYDGCAVATPVRSPTLDRLIEANRALQALTVVESSGDHKGLAAAVINGRVAYKRLYAHQSDQDLTTAQVTLIQTALGSLRARLKTFGYGIREGRLDATNRTGPSPAPHAGSRKHGSCSFPEKP
jgi:hypothetical protein